MRKLLFHIKISISFSKIFKFIYFFLRIRQKLEKDELAEFKTGVIKQTVKGFFNNKSEKLSKAVSLSKKGISFRTFFFFPQTFFD